MSVSSECEDVRDSDEDNNKTSQVEPEDKPSSVEGLSHNTVGQSASSSVEEGEEGGEMMTREKQQPSDVRDRSKILLHLSKQNNLDSQSRNIYHGKIYNYVLPAPRIIWTNGKQVGKEGRKVRELLDRAEVVEDKVLYLSSLLSLSRRTVLYSGAGLSTSSGVRQRGPGSCQPASRPRTTNAVPSPAHLLLSALVRAGLVQTWVTLSCDGLAQKAGCPQEAVLEVHGSWYDPSNPVLRKGGTIRPDIRERLREEEETADLVVVVGSSLTGSHPLVTKTSTRAGRGESLGSVIINLQETREDPGATLRLFSHSDTVAALLARRLNIAVREPDIRSNIQHRAWVNYSKEGVRTEPEGGMFLDLRPGQEVRLNNIHNWQNSRQPGVEHIREGARGRVVKYCPTQRAWELQLEGAKMLLGYWWLGDSTSLTGPLHLPVVNWRPSYK